MADIDYVVKSFWRHLDNDVKLIIRSLFFSILTSLGLLEILTIRVMFF